MSAARWLALVCMWLVSAISCSSKEKDKFDDWRPIEQWELQFKDVPGDAGAPAIQLYYGFTRDDTSQFEFIYRRIKVLNDKGKKYADVEIELGQETQLADLKARTIHPDGKITDFNDRVFDKTIFKSRGGKILGKAFTFPDVTVGSIVEYKYRLTWKGGFVYDSAWLLQHPLFTAKEEFRFKPYLGPLVTKDGIGGRVAMVYLNQFNDVNPQLKEGFWRLALQNVAGLSEEDYAPPDDEFKPVVYFYYGGHELGSPEAFWLEMSTLWTQRSERFIGNSRDVQEAASATIAGETVPEKKLRRLYARAQQIRNVSFERERTREELKREGLKQVESAAELLKRQYGTQSEINRLFVALARAAGFDAVILRVADRENAQFNKSILFARQLDTEIAGVELNGKLVFLDPGTKFCPYGLIRWNHSGVPGLRIGKDGGGFVDVPEPSPADSSISRVSDFSLDSEGLLRGDLTVEFKGEEALERRLAALSTDEAGRRKTLEEEITAILSPGAVVKLKDAQGWNEQDQPLVARFSIEVPSFASAAGKRLVAPAVLFQSRQSKIFISTFRRAPIVFPYSLVEEDTINLKLPKGYVVEQPPHERKTRLYYAGYEIRNSVSDGQLVIKRKLNLNGTRFGFDRFDEMKGFFSVVRAGDESEAVMQQEPTGEKQ